MQKQEENSDGASDNLKEHTYIPVCTRYACLSENRLMTFYVQEKCKAASATELPTSADTWEISGSGPACCHLRQFLWNSGFFLHVVIILLVFTQSSAKSCFTIRYCDLQNDLSLWSPVLLPIHSRCGLKLRLHRKLHPKSWSKWMAHKKWCRSCVWSLYACFDLPQKRPCGLVIAQPPYHPLVCCTWERRYFSDRTWPAGSAALNAANEPRAQPVLVGNRRNESKNESKWHDMSWKADATNHWILWWLSVLWWVIRSWSYKLELLTTYWYCNSSLLLSW